MMIDHYSIQKLKNRLGLMAVSMTIVACSTLSYMQSAKANASGQLHGHTTAFNSILEQEVSSLSNTFPDVRIALLDANTLFADVLPGEFSEPVQSCVQGPPLAPASAPTSICNNPADYIFFDEVHPTTAAHERIADVAIAAIDATIPGDVTELFIFGDSLSDRGNVFGFSGGTFPFPVAVQGPLVGEPLYANGSFTNGPVWWEFVAEDLGISDPVAYYENVAAGVFPGSSVGGINFAVGGATTGTDNAGNAQNPPFPIALPGLQDQVDAFETVLGPGGAANPDALYVVWAGPNDFLGVFLPEDPANPFAPFEDFTRNPTKPTNNISSAIEKLYALGARNFLVGNMYDLGDTPLADDL